MTEITICKDLNSARTSTQTNPCTKTTLNTVSNYWMGPKLVLYHRTEPHVKQAQHTLNQRFATGASQSAAVD